MRWIGACISQVIRGPAGDASASRILLILATICATTVSLAWTVVTFGLFFEWWEWSRFEGAIVSGGLGLLGVLLGSGGVYAANRFSFRPDALSSEREWEE